MRAYVKETFPRSERAAILRALAERPIAELAIDAGHDRSSARRAAASSR